MSNETPNPEKNDTTSEVTETNESQTPELTLEDLQKELETWKGHARTWEDRAKANKTAADKLKEIEDANKTELEKALERVTALETELNSSKQSALRSSIIAEFKIDQEDAEIFLTAQDEETLRLQAEKLAAKTAQNTKPKKVSLNNSDIEGTPEPNSKASLAKSLLGL